MDAELQEERALRLRAEAAASRAQDASRQAEQAVRDHKDLEQYDKDQELAKLRRGADSHCGGR